MNAGHSVTGALLLAALSSAPALATEGGLGRAIPGTALQAKAALVPPIALTAINVSTVWFEGDIGAAREVPIAGEAALGLDAKVSLTPITLLKVWDTGPGRWNFASAVTLPVIWNEVTADVRAGPVTRSVRDDNLGIFDIAITPIIASYHLDEKNHLAGNFTVWAPVGSYEAGRLSNIGLNYWTFVPGLAYTYFDHKQGIELTGQVAVQVNTRNEATNYKSAPLLTVDAIASKAFASGLGVGATLSWIQQIGDDEGVLADRLNGFRGHDIALGPLISYSTKVKGVVPLDLSFRWLPSLSSRNRLSGDTLMFTLSMPIAVKMPPGGAPGHTPTAGR
jgi:hypothetical protein